MCIRDRFTVFGDDESIFSALRAGADGYLLKDASSEEVLELSLIHISEPTRPY